MGQEYTRRSSLTWTFFLLVLLTTQLDDSEAFVSLKVKKLLKKALLLKALTSPKGIAIIPIPIPLSLLQKLKEKKEEEKKTPPPMPYPMHTMEYAWVPPKEMDMMMPPPKDGKMMPSGHYGMIAGMY
ncbi:uncharacterized protein LOC118181395 [Stegodyphus dumicola]|uniref:uncharacterized protein LOC118181395 n=1 Tax=Stegodyphus dumicola TaxID=202533 RepID=UPI0015B26331|nr:uncharacterized protein LOC118181395 [Stegodyphus dumicola]